MSISVHRLAEATFNEFNSSKTKGVLEVPLKIAVTAVEDVDMTGFDRTEANRLAALRNLDILGTPREKVFDDVAHVASQLFGSPIALVSLVDSDHQWFKSCIGLPVDRTSREVSFCSHAIAQDDLDQVFVVSDATTDPRFCSNPLVTGEPHIRFYAGAPLVTRAGQPIGSLCVIDTQPRQPTPGQLQALRVLGRSVVAQMELRKSADELRESEERTRLIIDTALDALITLDATLCIADLNPRAISLFEVSKERSNGQSFHSFLFGADAPVDPAFLAFFETHGAATTKRDIELVLKRRNGTTYPAELCVSPIPTRRGWIFSVSVRDISARRVQESERRESETRDVVLFAMARLAESRDPETGAHIERVQGYCQILAEQLAAAGPYQHLCDREFIHLMYTTSPLHDIGKVGIPDDVLLKPGRLSDREFEIMKSHAAIGAETLEAAMTRFPNARFLKMARNIAASHHERFDGTGYPKGLSGDAIPLCGRIVAIADVYDALTSRRVYKAAFTHDIARAIIRKESGKHFDPVIVQAFIQIESKFETIYQQLAEQSSIAA